MTTNSKNPGIGPASPAPKKGKKGFQKGVSGNPGGRPKGSGNKFPQIFLALLEANTDEISSAVVEKAKAGDSAILRLIFERFIPVIRSRTIPIKMPELSSAEDIMKAYDVIFNSFALEEITLDELERLTDVLEKKRKAIETFDLANEMLRIKEQLGGYV